MVNMNYLPELENPRRKYKIENATLKFSKTGIFRLGLYLRIDNWPTLVLCYLIYDLENKNKFYIERFFKTLNLEYQEPPYIDLKGLINKEGIAIFQYIPAWGQKKFKHYIGVKKFLKPLTIRTRKKKVYIKDEHV